ncbi:hypothetical protein FEK40_18890 [Escherichia coli]|nr:hypothetical protein [Escherichia coli]
MAQWFEVGGDLIGSLWVSLGLFGSLCDLNYWIGPVDKNQRISRTGNSTLLWIFKDIRIMTKSRV